MSIKETRQSIAKAGFQCIENPQPPIGYTTPQPGPKQLAREQEARERVQWVFPQSVYGPVNIVKDDAYTEACIG